MSCQQEKVSESLLKKRARDRRAQQNLRDKRVAHIKTLEHRITTLDIELQGLRQTCYALRQENDILRSRQEHIQHLVFSWAHENPLECGSTAADVRPTSDSIERVSSHTGICSDHETNDYRSTNPTQSPAHQIRSGVNTTQGAASSPTSRRFDLIFTDTFAQCLNRSDLVHLAPETPQPVDFSLRLQEQLPRQRALLHAATRPWLCRDPDRLAFCWLTYPLGQVAACGRARRALLAPPRLPDPPVPEQLRRPAPGAYERREVAFDAGLLPPGPAGPFGELVLEPADDGRLRVRTDFYDAFTQLGGWGLTKEFLDKYPALVEGLGAASVCCEVY
ncbi:hypothetical protein Hte_008093 [Hypoxylon texense]